MFFNEELKFSAEILKEQLVEIRRHFHRYPETAFEEEKTGEYISSLLEKLGLKVQKNVAGTGVTALLKGSEPGKTIALRADMDALPLQDGKDADYSSRYPGVCHACGHDAHMTVVLGAAMLLLKYSEKIKGQVKFIFQPAEEKPPGGACFMIEAGVLTQPSVDAILGIHTNPYYPVGSVALKRGPVMAAADSFKIKIIGSGGHGAAPHQTVDSVVVASQVIQALQLISSRRVNPIEPVVLSIGKIQGGEKFNIIAAEVEMEGTVRTLSSELRDRMEGMIDEILKGITSACGAAYELEYTRNYPVLVNEDKVTALVEEASREILGEENTLIMESPLMGSEDFAHYLEHVPGSYLFLGVAPEAGKSVHPWHHQDYDINEESLPVGAAVLAWAALKLLE
ncbi:M20 metallopeptidase family protein [Candidatus Contubernalis alkaliaceticus]|uniref:M20 metallopeptidase family protein n=1 Tax=Candidatus Contubernalis alkaliaceticus TaxID=338645 RepID=UPI001F4C119B|nr:amidohydrolase [Candidatus Contubernalis alkalaceticus]UNC92944.1 amidohydrolase [Candidatus Contubernalis alkalaceticus]